MLHLILETEHRILTRGGIFIYPRDVKDPSKPGKLRLMYEVNPMAMIVTQAGAAATNGHHRILDLQPKKPHAKVAVFLGSRDEVGRVTGYHGDEDKCVPCVATALFTIQNKDA